MRPQVSFCRCGTEKEWNMHQRQYSGMNRVVPGTIYVSERGLCLVTSQEWVDWLTGKTDKIPCQQ